MSAILTYSDKWADKVKMYSNRWCWSVTPFWPRLNNKKSKEVQLTAENIQQFWGARRNCLCVSSQFYDPLGLCSCVTITMKIAMERYNHKVTTIDYIGFIHFIGGFIILVLGYSVASLSFLLECNIINIKSGSTQVLVTKYTLLLHKKINCRL